MINEDIVNELVWKLKYAGVNMDPLKESHVRAALKEFIENVEQESVKLTLNHLNSPGSPVYNAVENIIRRTR
uniref:Uncharacterized protein n=1 Tax=Methanococcus maripaludis (strain C6 / ATCC BAA-1332) TaxID=444158 RepID=A9A7K3_METM6